VHTVSRSRRKTSIVGNTNCRSERQDKKIWHQRWRTLERAALTSASAKKLSNFLPLLENQVSSSWTMDKDGKHFFSPDRQVVLADRLADGKGKTDQERASLKRRLLRKWMGK